MYTGIGKYPGCPPAVSELPMFNGRSDQDITSVNEVIQINYLINNHQHCYIWL